MYFCALLDDLEYEVDLQLGKTFPEPSINDRHVVSRQFGHEHWFQCGADGEIASTCTSGAHAEIVWCASWYKWCLYVRILILKLFDASRRDKAINSKSHRKSDWAETFAMSETSWSLADEIVSIVESPTDFVTVASDPAK